MKKKCDWKEKISLNVASQVRWRLVIGKINVCQWTFHINNITWLPKKKILIYDINGFIYLFIIKDVFRIKQLSAFLFFLFLYDSNLKILMTVYNCPESYYTTLVLFGISLWLSLATFPEATNFNFVYYYAKDFLGAFYAFFF